MGYTDEAYTVSGIEIVGNGEWKPVQYTFTNKYIELPTRCIQSNGTTILFFGKEKEIVKTSKDDKFNPTFGFLMAYFKKTSGMSRTQASKFIKKMLGVENNV